MRIRIDIDSATLKSLVEKYIDDQLGSIIVNPKFVVIEVKSRQNYKAEWETGDFRASYTHDNGGEA